MRSSAAVLGLLCATLLPCLACDKGSETGSAGASSASAASPAVVAPPPSTAAAPPPSAAASAAVSLPKCPAGLTGNAVPAFCIKLPASYKPKDVRTSPTKGSIAYDTGTATDNLMISYDETPIPQQAKDVEGELKFGGDKLEKKSDLPGGGKWYLGAHQDYERVVTLVKGPAGLTFKCSFAYKPKSAPPAGATDACKSIVLPSGT
ncbi:MAG: hypothetical protein ACRELB_16555 [Polyangiaceae bacterium]